MKSQGDLRPDPQSQNKRPPPSGGRRSTVAALIAVVLLAALLFWISQAILSHNRLQNCIDSGRRDCVPVDTGGS